MRFIKNEITMDMLKRRNMYIRFDSQEEINKLALEYKETGDKDILENIINQVSRLVLSIAKKYDKVGKVYDLSDLYQEGIFGVMHALKKYDSEKDTNFSSYCMRWVHMYISRAARAFDYPFSASDQSAFRINKFFNYIDNIPKDSKYNRDKASKDLNLGKDALKTYEKMNRSVVYLDVPVNEKDTSYTYTYDYVLKPSNNIDEFNDKLIQDQIAETLRNIYKEALSEKEYDIMLSRYKFGENGVEEAVPYKVVANDRGVSYQCIQQIEKRAKNKIFDYVNDNINYLQYKELLCI